MNKRIVFYIVGVITTLVGIGMLVSAGVSLLMKDTLRDTAMLAGCGLTVLLLSGSLHLLCRPKSQADKKVGIREGFAIVALGWTLASLAGALPFLAVSRFFPADALFETVSGFSTTGATVISPGMELYDGGTLPLGVDSLPYGILFWRSLTHWFGGMGIVVLTIAILPLLNIGSQSLYNAETTGVKSSDSRIAPRIASAAKILWLIYLGLTLAETILLRISGMSLFDAVCHSFSTISTGGFSTHQDSIAYYRSPWIEWIVIFFMFFSGVNFLLHIRFLSGNFTAFWKDEEFRVYLFAALLATVGITLVLCCTRDIQDGIFRGSFFHHPLDSLRTAAFQVVSISTTTGFSTADYDTWPAVAGMVLFVLTFLGGCGGSTSGGLKFIRAILLSKFSVSEVRRCIFPNLVPDIRISGIRMESAAIQKAVGFFACYLGIYLLFALILPVLSETLDMETALSASISCLSNVGPGFGRVGPAGAYGWISAPAKYLLSFEMLLGRLELYTLLVLFLPSFWKK